MKLWRYTAYTGLAVATYFFLHTMFNEFSEGLTIFQISQKPLSQKDNPVVTFCFFKFHGYGLNDGMELGNVINISVSRFMPTSQAPIPVEDVQISKLTLYNTAEYVRGATRHCFKMEAMSYDQTKWATRIDIAVTPNEVQLLLLCLSEEFISAFAASFKFVPACLY